MYKKSKKKRILPQKTLNVSVSGKCNGNSASLPGHVFYILMTFNRRFPFIPHFPQSLPQTCGIPAEGVCR